MGSRTSDNLMVAVALIGDVPNTAGDSAGDWRCDDSHYGAGVVDAIARMKNKGLMRKGEAEEIKRHLLK